MQFLLNVADKINSSKDGSVEKYSNKIRYVYTWTNAKIMTENISNGGQQVHHYHSKPMITETDLSYSCQ